MQTKICKKNRKRTKYGLFAAMALMLTMGIAQPAQAAVTQSDLKAPEMDIDSHNVEDWVWTLKEDYQTYHKATYSYVYFGMYPQSAK